MENHRKKRPCTERCGKHLQGLNLGKHDREGPWKYTTWRMECGGMREEVGGYCSGLRGGWLGQEVWPPPCAEPGLQR